MKQKVLLIYYRILIFFAHRHLSRHKPKVIGINGSVGKTSCRMIIYQTLEQYFPNLKIYTSPKNFNGELGLSLSVLKIEERTPSLRCMFKTFWISFFRWCFGKKEYDIVVLEYGIDRPGEMDFILKVAHPDIGVFTAIDAVHSEQFGSPAEIAKEEVKMALHTKELVFLNHDDNYAMELLPRIEVDKLTYQTKGYDEDADISFSESEFILGGASHEIKSAFTLDIKGKKYQIITNLIGKANYGYIGVAFAVAETLAYQSLTLSSWTKWRIQSKEKDKNLDSSHALRFAQNDKIELNYQLQPGRLSIFAGKYDSIIFDSTYNASPLSMRKTIDTVLTIRNALFPASEIRLILGDMRELGDLTEKEHRLLAGYVSQSADKLFLLGDSMKKYLADEIEKCWFDSSKFFVANNLKSLNSEIEQLLKNLPAKNPLSRWSGTSPSQGRKIAPPLLVFKGSQNTIFLEESVKHFLANEKDAKLLTRQGEFWEEKKREFIA